MLKWKEEDLMPEQEITVKNSWKVKIDEWEDIQWKLN